MALPTTKEYEKLLDMGNGLAIYLVHLDALREQDKNARVMSPSKFERLVANIGNDARLESLPLCVAKKAIGGDHLEFHIISGHHRTRAARKAGLKEIHVLVHEGDLSRDEIVAKQLAHNALNGEDDAQVLKELFEEIEAIDERLYSGISDDEFKNLTAPKIDMEEIGMNFDYEVVEMIFLKSDFEKYDELLQTLNKDAKLEYVDHAQYERFKATVRKVFNRDDVRNATAAIVRMMDIVDDFYKNADAELSKKAAELAGDTPKNDKA